jgi:hypothetical protein
MTHTEVIATLTSSRLSQPLRNALYEDGVRLANRRHRRWRRQDERALRVEETWRRAWRGCRVVRRGRRRVVVTACRRMHGVHRCIVWIDFYVFGVLLACKKL